VVRPSVRGSGSEPDASGTDPADGVFRELESSCKVRNPPAPTPALRTNTTIPAAMALVERRIQERAKTWLGSGGALNHGK
jgi:hypothetical protein